jgi:hypothetical protein
MQTERDRGGRAETSMAELWEISGRKERQRRELWCRLRGMPRSGGKPGTYGDIGEFIDVSLYSWSQFWKMHMSFRGKPTRFEPKGNNLKDAWRFRRMSVFSKCLGFFKTAWVFHEDASSLSEELKKLVGSFRWAWVLLWKWASGQKKVGYV